MEENVKKIENVETGIESQVNPNTIELFRTIRTKEKILQEQKNTLDKMTNDFKQKYDLFVKTKEELEKVIFELEAGLRSVMTFGQTINLIPEDPEMVKKLIEFVDADIYGENTEETTDK